MTNEGSAEDVFKTGYPHRYGEDEESTQLLEGILADFEAFIAKPDQYEILYEGMYAWLVAGNGVRLCQGDYTLYLRFIVLLGYQLQVDRKRYTWLSEEEPTEAELEEMRAIAATSSLTLEQLQEPPWFGQDDDPWDWIWVSSPRFFYRAVTEDKYRNRTAYKFD